MNVCLSSLKTLNLIYKCSAYIVADENGYELHGFIDTPNGVSFNTLSEMRHYLSLQVVNLPSYVPSSRTEN